MYIEPVVIMLKDSWKRECECDMEFRKCNSASHSKVNVCVWKHFSKEFLIKCNCFPFQDEVASLSAINLRKLGSTLMSPLQKAL